MANILSQETLIDIAAIGGGSVIAAQVVNNFAPKITKMVKLEKNDYANNAVPILVGIFLPSLAGGGRIVNGIANGMIAYGAANIVDAAIKGVSKPKDEGTNTAAAAAATGGGTTGFMGNVMMQGVGENVMMGQTDDYNTYSSDSYDMTSADAGEMNF